MNGNLSDLKEVFKILEEIRNESSTNSKQDILSKYKDNEILRNILFITYNPFLQYNIRKIPVDIKECEGTEITLVKHLEFLNILIKLNKRVITGNDAIDTLRKYLISITPQEYNLYTKVINKNLDIGMAIKMINKVFKDLIPIYEVMLANKIDVADLNLDNDKIIKKLPKEMIVQYKIDGYRLNIHSYEDGRVKVCTRNGKEVHGYKDLEKEISSLFPSGYVYDGEMVSEKLFEWIRENEALSEKVNDRSLFTEAISKAFSKEDNKTGIFNIFDMVPIKEWETQRTKEPLSLRTERMATIFKNITPTHTALVPTSRVFNKDNKQDLSEIVKLFRYYDKIGWEGCMIKDWNSNYKFKRSNSLLKMKFMDTIDLPVVDVFEGTGKYKGMLGGVFVDYKGYKVGVGSGWTDAERIEYWNDKNKILGKIIEVSYQSESINKHNELSLSFPIVKTVRLDK